MIYFARLAEGAPIKIGCTEHSSSRIVSLRGVYGKAIYFMAVMDGGFDFEAELHARFAHLCRGTAANHEWFDPAPELLEYIVANGRPMVGSDSTCPIRLELAEDIRDDMRMMAAAAKMSMAALARGIITEAVEAWRKKGSKP